MKKNCIVLILAALLLPWVAGAQCSITLPWGDDFDSYTVTGGNSKPDCWTRVDSTTSGSAVYPNLYNQGSAGHDKVISFSSQCASCQNDYIYIATPRIPAPQNQLEISFDLLRGSLSVFLATDLTDRSSFVLLGTYENASYTQWTTIEIRTDTVTMDFDTAYVVFGKAVTSSYSVSYLDNVTVRQLNPCQRPNWVRANAVMTNSATLAWPSVTGLQGYRVSYNTVDDLSSAMVQNTTSTRITLTGLETGTDYYVWVQGVCSETMVSDPRTTTFTTQLPCYPIVNLRMVNISTYAASFAWDYDMRGNEADGVLVTLQDLTDSTYDEEESYSTGATYHFVSGLTPEHEYLITFRTLCDADSAEAVSLPLVFRACGATETSEAANDNSRDFPFNMTYNYSYSQTLYPASDFYDMDTIWGLAVRRDTSGLGVADTRRVSIWMGNSSASASSSSVSVAGMTHVAHGDHLLKAQEWDTVLFSTPFIYDGHSNVQIVICDSTGTDNYTNDSPKWRYHASEWPTYYNFNQTSAYNPNSLTSTRSLLALADMRFLGGCNANYDCEAPVAVLSAVDSLTASFEWTSGTGAGWIVEVRNQGDFNWTVVDTVMEESYTLTGLVPSMRYEVRIGSLCDQQTRYTSPVAFVTSCAMQHLPFHFNQTDMVAAATAGFTDCWSYTTNFFRGRLTMSHRGYVCNAGNGEWFMLPPLSEPVATARLRSWISCSSTSTVLVGVAGESNCSDVVWVDTLTIPAGNPNTSTDEYIAYLDGYTGDGNRVVVSPIVDNNYTFVYFFDFHLEPIEGCRPPVRLTLDSADASSLSVSWTPVGESNTWLVYLDGVQVGTTTDDPSFTITGLAPYTRHEVTVRSYCGGTDTSLAVTETFLTGCENGGCSFTIDGCSSTADGWNGGSLVVTSGSREIGRAKMTRGSQQSWTFMVCDSMPLNFAWLSGNADEVCSFLIRNEAGDTLYQAAGAVGLGDSIYTTANICGTSGDDPDDPNDPDDPDDPDGIGSVAASRVTLAPNPASSTVTLSGIEGNATVCILDLNGREVYRRQSVSGSLTVDVTGMAKGVYLVRVVSAEAATTRRFIVR